MLIGLFRDNDFEIYRRRKSQGVKEEGDLKSYRFFFTIVKMLMVHLVIMITQAIGQKKKLYMRERISAILWNGKVSF